MTRLQAHGTPSSWPPSSHHHHYLDAPLFPPRLTSLSPLALAEVRLARAGDTPIRWWTFEVDDPPPPFSRPDPGWSHAVSGSHALAPGDAAVWAALDKLRRARRTLVAMAASIAGEGDDRVRATPSLLRSPLCALSAPAPAKRRGMESKKGAPHSDEDAKGKGKARELDDEVDGMEIGEDDAPMHGPADAAWRAWPRLWVFDVEGSSGRTDAEAVIREAMSKHGLRECASGSFTPSALYTSESISSPPRDASAQPHQPSGGEGSTPQHRALLNLLPLPAHRAPYAMFLEAVRERLAGDFLRSRPSPDADGVQGAPNDSQGTEAFGVNGAPRTPDGPDADLEGKASASPSRHTLPPSSSSLPASTEPVNKDNRWLPRRTTRRRPKSRPLVRLGRGVLFLPPPSKEGDEDAWNDWRDALRGPERLLHVDFKIQLTTSSLLTQPLLQHLPLSPVLARPSYTSSCSRCFPLIDDTPLLLAPFAERALFVRYLSSEEEISEDAKKRFGEVLEETGLDGKAVGGPWLICQLPAVAADVVWPAALCFRDFSASLRSSSSAAAAAGKDPYRSSSLASVGLSRSDAMRIWRTKSLLFTADAFLPTSDGASTSTSPSPAEADQPVASNASAGPSSIEDNKPSTDPIQAPKEETMDVPMRSASPEERSGAALVPSPQLANASVPDQQTLPFDWDDDNPTVELSSSPSRQGADDAFGYLFGSSEDGGGGGMGLVTEDDFSFFDDAVWGSGSVGDASAGDEARDGDGAREALDTIMEEADLSSLFDAFDAAPASAAAQPAVVAPTGPEDTPAPMPQAAPTDASHTTDETPYSAVVKTPGPTSGAAPAGSMTSAGYTDASTPATSLSLVGNAQPHPLLPPLASPVHRHRFVPSGFESIDFLRGMRERDRKYFGGGRFGGDAELLSSAEGRRRGSEEMEDSVVPPSSGLDGSATPRSLVPQRRDAPPNGYGPGPGPGPGLRPYPSNGTAAPSEDLLKRRRLDHPSFSFGLSRISTPPHVSNGIGQQSSLNDGTDGTKPVFRPPLEKRTSWVPLQTFSQLSLGENGSAMASDASESEEDEDEEMYDDGGSSLSEEGDGHGVDGADGLEHHGHAEDPLNEGAERAQQLILLRHCGLTTAPNESATVAKADRPILSRTQRKVAEERAALFARLLFESPSLQSAIDDKRPTRAPVDNAQTFRRCEVEEVSALLGEVLGACSEERSDANEEDDSKKGGRGRLLTTGAYLDDLHPPYASSPFSKYTPADPSVANPGKPELLEPPLFSLSCQSSVVKVAPTALRFWDKLGLGPLFGRTDVLAVGVLVDDGGRKEGEDGMLGLEADQEARLREWISRLGSSWSLYGLGQHRLLDSGLVRCWRSPASTETRAWDVESLVEGLSGQGFSAGTSHFLLYALLPPSSQPLSAMSVVGGLREALTERVEVFQKDPTRLHIQPVRLLDALLPSALATNSLRTTVMSIHDSLKHRIHLNIPKPLYADIHRFQDIHLPAFALAGSSNAKPRFEVQWPISSNDALNWGTLLHVGYSFLGGPDGLEWALVTCIDGRGHGWDARPMKLKGPNGSQASASSFLPALRRVWKFVKTFACRASLRWKVVVCRAGRMGGEEMEAWTLLASEDSFYGFDVTIACAEGDGAPALVPCLKTCEVKAVLPQIRSPGTPLVFLDSSTAVYALYPRQPLLIPSRSSPTSNTVLMNDVDRDQDTPGLLALRTSHLVFVPLHADHSFARMPVPARRRRLSTPSISTLSLHLLFISPLAGRPGEMSVTNRLRDITTSYHGLCVLERERRHPAPLHKHASPSAAGSQCGTGLPWHLEALRTLRTAVEALEEGEEGEGG